MSPTLRSALTVLLACGLIAALATVSLGARRQARSLDLLRLENQALTQEIRLLHQQLEAERILAAAQLRAPATAPLLPPSPNR